LSIVFSFRSSPVRRFGYPEPVVELDQIVGLCDRIETLPRVMNGWAT
jgi:hypothetical protein